MIANILWDQLDDKDLNAEYFYHDGASCCNASFTNNLLPFLFKINETHYITEKSVLKLMSFRTDMFF